MKRKTPVKITRVAVRSSVQLKQFQHIHIEAEAEVQYGYSPSQTVDALKTFVAAELRRAKEGDEPQPVVRPGRFPKFD